MANLILNGSTSGSVTLSSPAVSGTTTLTLPVQTGTVMVNGPAFSFYQSSAQTLSSNTTTKITFTSSVFDTTSGMFASSRFTPTIAGYYQINALISVASTQCSISPIIYKNGTSYQYGNNGTSAMASMGVSSIVYLNGSTDYVEIYGVFSTGQNTLANSALTYFNGIMVRSA
jgi:hypothetical protein